MQGQCEPAGRPAGHPLANRIAAIEVEVRIEQQLEGARHVVHRQSRERAGKKRGRAARDRDMHLGIEREVAQPCGEGITGSVRSPARDRVVARASRSRTAWGVGLGSGVKINPPAGSQIVSGKPGHRIPWPFRWRPFRHRSGSRPGCGDRLGERASDCPARLYGVQRRGVAVPQYSLARDLAPSDTVTPEGFPSILPQ